MNFYNKPENDIYHITLGYQKILDACSHFDCHSDLNNRSFFLTISLSHASEAKHKGLIYKRICKCLRYNNILDGKLDPGLVLEIDFSQSRQLQVTKEYPHLHGVMILPKRISLDQMNLVSRAVDGELKKLHFVKKSTTQIYDHIESLGYTQDYSGKYGKISSAAANPSSDHGKIYPIDKVRSENRSKSNMYEKWQQRADIRRTAFFWDPRTFLSDDYCSMFSEELAEISTNVSNSRRKCGGATNVSSINKDIHGNIKMLKEIELMSQSAQELDRLPIRTFLNCQQWAEGVVESYRSLRLKEANRGDATKWLVRRVADFAYRMDQDEKLDLIHKSTVQRLRNVIIQERSCWGIVMLLLASVDRELFTRSVRHRAAKRASVLMDTPCPSPVGDLSSGHCTVAPMRMAA